MCVCVSLCVVLYRTLCCYTGRLAKTMAKQWQSIGRNIDAILDACVGVDASDSTMPMKGVKWLHIRQQLEYHKDSGQESLYKVTF